MNENKPMNFFLTDLIKKNLVDDFVRLLFVILLKIHLE